MAGGNELFSSRSESGNAHEQHQRVGAVGGKVADRFVAGEHAEPPGHPTVRHRYAGRGGDRDRARDAWNDLDRDASLLAGEALLATATEHVRVTTLEANDDLPGLGPVDQDAVDLVLGDRV